MVIYDTVPTNHTIIEVVIQIERHLFSYCHTYSAYKQIFTKLAHGRWFYPGTLASSTSKTDVLLKVALRHQQSNQINYSQSHRQTYHRRHVFLSQCSGLRQTALFNSIFGCNTPHPNVWCTPLSFIEIR
jgi:hypothetical protein